MFLQAGLDDIFRCPGTSHAVLLREKNDFVDRMADFSFFLAPHDSAGPFTALFPSNDSFMNVDPARLEFLLEPENIQELQDVLLYHVLPGLTLTDGFVSGPADTLLPLFPVQVSVDPNIMFDDGSVETPDVPGSNGIFNVIDALLDPSLESKFMN